MLNEKGQYLTLAIVHILQGSSVVSLATRSLAIVGKPPLTHIDSLLSYALPVLGYKVEAIRNHYGTFCHAALVIFALFCLYSGQSAFAIPYLTVLSLGFLERAAFCPAIAKRLISYATKIILILSAGIAGWLFILIAAAFSVYDRFAKKAGAIPCPELREVPAALQRYTPLQVNRDHVRYHIGDDTTLQLLQTRRLDILTEMLKDLPASDLIIDSLREPLGLEPPAMQLDPLLTRLNRLSYTWIGMVNEFWEKYEKFLTDCTFQARCEYYRYHILEEKPADGPGMALIREAPLP
jgi:hypothetical protein